MIRHDGDRECVWALGEPLGVRGDHMTAVGLGGAFYGAVTGPTVLTGFVCTGATRSDRRFRGVAGA